MPTSLFAAVGDTGKLTTSPDGTTWTSRTSGFGTTSIRGVAWSPSLALFAAVGLSGKLTTSPDGTTWTSRTSGFGADAIYGVAWSPSLALFVAVGSAGKLTTSPDGTTWTSRTSGFGADAIYGVAWSPSLALFVAAGAAGKLSTSPDGITWTTRTSGFGADSIYGVAWSPSLALFAAVGNTGKLSTSPDGITWTTRTSGFGADPIYGVAWSPSLALFVAVGGAGKLITSPDGTTWTSRTSGFGTTWFRGVAWSPSLALFAAVGDAGNLTTSPDGTTWTSRTSGFGTTTIFGVAWSLVSNVAPNAPTPTSPANNATIDLAVTQRFAWASSDPDPGDSQSKFDLQYRLIGAATWTAVTGTTPNQFVDFAPSTFAAGNYEWQARTYDALGLVGPYSASSFFTAANAPAQPTITDPINGATIGAASYTATISAPNVNASEWRTVADNAGAPNTSVVYQTSGVLEDPTRRTYTFAFPANNRTEHLQARIRNNGLWSTWADSTNPISYTPPAAPVVTLTAEPATGSLLVTIVNPTPGTGQPAVSYNDVYVDDGDGKGWVRKATALATNTAWRYWLPVGYLDYTGANIRVTAVATNGTTATGTP